MKFRSRSNLNLHVTDPKEFNVAFSIICHLPGTSGLALLYTDSNTRRAAEAAHQGFGIRQNLPGGPKQQEFSCRFCGIGA